MFNCHCGNFCLQHCHLEKDISRSDILIRIIFWFQASVFLSLFGSVAVKPAKLLIDFLDWMNEIPDVLLLTWAGWIHCYFTDIKKKKKNPLSATQTEFSCIIWWRDIFKTSMSSANIVCVQTIWKETQDWKRSIQSNQGLQHMYLLLKILGEKLWLLFKCQVMPCG